MQKQKNVEDDEYTVFEPETASPATAVFVAVVVALGLLMAAYIAFEPTYQPQVTKIEVVGQ